MFTNLGLLGGLSFLWLALAALVRSGRNILREKPGAPWFIGLGAMAAMVAFFFHGFMDYFLFSTPLYVIFWALMSIAVMWPLMAVRGRTAPAGLEGD